MRRRLRDIGADLRQGHNVDVYLAVAAATVVGTLGIIGVLDLRWTASILLLCMVPLLNLVLALNDHLERIRPHGTLPLMEFPEETLRKDWARTNDLLLVGVTLIRTVRTHEGDLARRLHAGRRVRVLVVDPGDPLVMEWTDRRRQYGDADPQANAAEVRITLGSLARLSQLADPKLLAVRTIRFPIGLGGYSFAPHRPEARLYVETYPFKTPETYPHFVISAVDGHWLDHFTSELENMWNEGEPVDLSLLT